MKHPRLQNAPITEAVLEIRTDLPPGTGGDELDVFAKAIGPTYSNRRERVRVSLSIAGEGATSSKEVDGLWIQHRDEPQVVQARLDGFAFSRLHPYDRWDSLRDEAKQLWDTYCRVLKPIRVTRLGLRYINAIELPVDDDPSKVLTLLPALPSILAPVGLSGFTLEFISDHPDFEATAKVLEHLPNVAQGAQTVSVILDVDVFKLRELAPDDPAVWEHLAQLRELKNVVFFNTITPATRERYE
jgi:uncharacterized protein (TIGR04255 family)